MAKSRTTVVGSDVGELIDFIDTGIDHCRAGRWEKGADYLGYVAERNNGDLSQAGLYFSYLGCAIARVQKRKEEALRLCEHAVKVEFYQPDNWANLGDVFMLFEERGQAIESVRQGLRIDPEHERLLELSQSLGMRRRPVFRFLQRSNPLNHLLGKLRNDVFGPPRS